MLPMGVNRNRRRSGGGRSHTQREMKRLGGKKPRPGLLLGLRCGSQRMSYPASHGLCARVGDGGVRHSALEVLDSKASGLHFAATLRIWRERFQAQARQIELLGFDDAFRRTWLFFLTSTKASFQTGLCDVHQYILA